MLIRLAVCLCPVNLRLAAALISKEHVLADRHIRDQRQLLMDNDNSFFLAVLDLCELTQFPII